MTKQRLEIFVPESLYKSLLIEAQTRLLQRNMKGRISLGGTIRDILVILLNRHLQEITELSADEYERALKESQYG